MASNDVVIARLRRDARHSLPLSQGDLALAAQAVYPSEELYQRALRWQYRDEFDKFILLPGSFGALTGSGVNIPWLVKRLKVRPWQPTGSVLWQKAPPAQTEVLNAMPCPDFGFSIPVASQATSSQLQRLDGKPASPLLVRLPWEDADPTRPAWEKAGSAHDDNAWSDAACPRSLAMPIVEAAAAAVAPARADDVTPPPTPPPPPPEGWVGICFEHYQPPPPPPNLAADPQDFFIGSDRDDASEGEDVFPWGAPPSPPEARHWQ